MIGTNQFFFSFLYKNFFICSFKKYFYLKIKQKNQKINLKSFISVIHKLKKNS